MRHDGRARFGEGRFVLLFSLILPDRVGRSSPRSPSSARRSTCTVPRHIARSCCIPTVAWLFRFCTLGDDRASRTKEWVAVHRKHHAFTDEEGDPHSPELEGFWKVQFGNVFYYITRSEEDRRRRTLRAAT